jgi:glycosyltransferase involved in cell wall biosynthesis
LKRVIYIVSDINKALSFEWIALGLKNKFDLKFILIGKEGSVFSAFLKSHLIKYYEIDETKYPTKLHQGIQLFKILRRERPDTIHTHLWKANLLGLSVSWILRIKQRIYTRHHATIHYDQFPAGRKWDIMCNKMATHIVAISRNIQEILIDRDKADSKKIHLIHHGFDLDYFKLISDEQVQRLRTKYDLTSNSFPVIGVVSRYVDWKGIQYIIPGFQKVLIRHPRAKLILANAHGDYEGIVKQMLNSLPKESFIEIKFEENLAALYNLFDVFVHVPIDPYVEAFGQTYVESLIVRVPSVFTMSGVAREFIKHKHNAWVVDFKNSDQIADGINEILNNSELKENLMNTGSESVQQFSLDQYLLALEKLYTSLK